jgi:hypothetical protein
MTTRFHFLLWAALACTVGATAFACKNNTNPAPLQATDQTVTGDEVPADFTAFHQRFLSDSAYQMAHITWPLQGAKGLQQDTTFTAQNVYWQAAEWHVHRADAMDPNDFIREVKNIGNVLVIERIRAKAVPFGIERRFAKQANNEWELIYYADVLEFKQ